MIEEYAELGVYWFPTILFAIFVIVGALRGFRRGLRKSTILLINSLVAFLICFVLYLLLVGNEGVDKLLLKLINLIMGDEAALQKYLSVSTSAETLKEVLVQYLPTLAGDNAIGIILRDNGNYLLALVLFAYHIVFFSAMFVLYKVLDFIFYLVYLFGFSERKYKKKKLLKMRANDGLKYHKHPISGAAVGTVRGVFAGLLSLSVLGGILSMLVGGLGLGTLPQHSFDDEVLDAGYGIYRSIDRYGAKGIYKVLNSVRDPYERPYYLYAFDLVFSTDLVDPETDEKDVIYFREELSAYIGFTKEVAALMLRYAGDEINDAVLRGEGDVATITQNVFADASFRLEFSNIIHAFETPKFFSGFALSLVDSIAANIDEIGLDQGMDENTVDLVKVLFKKGYYSSVIPSESSKIGQEDLPVLPYLHTADLLEKNDIVETIDLVMDVMALTEDATLSTTVNAVLSHVANYSFFSEAKRPVFNPVFGRLYNFIDAVYLQGESSTYIQRNYDNEYVDWTQELLSLGNVADGIATIYENVFEEEAEQDLIQSLVSVFDSDQPYVEENIAAFDKICQTISDSHILGRILASSLVYSAFEDSLGSTIEGFDMPPMMVYENTYSNGVLTKRGELYNVLMGLRSLLSGETAETAKQLLSGEDFDENSIGDILALFLKKGENGELGVADYLFSSELFRSIISAEIISVASDFLVVPNAAKETHPTTHQSLNIIKEEEIRSLIAALDSFFGISDGNSFAFDENFINNIDLSSIDSAYDSLIIRCTITQLVEDMLVDNGLLSRMTVEYIKHGEEYFSKQEIVDLVDGIKIGLGIDSFSDLSSLNDGFGNLNGIFDHVTDVYKSEILKCVVSNKLDELLVDNELVARSDLNVIKGASLYYSQEEIVDMMDGIKNGLGIEDLDSFTSIDFNSVQDGVFNHIETVYNSDILKCVTTSLLDKLMVGSNILDKGTLRELRSFGPYYETQDVVDLIGGIKEGLGISDFNTMTIDFDSIKSRLLTNIDDIYSSRILQCAVTKKISEQIDTVSVFQDHPDAYTALEGTSLKVYKRSEMQNLAHLLSGFADFASADLNSFSITDLMDFYTSDADGNVTDQFYLLSSSISKNVSANGILVLKKSDFMDRADFENEVPAGKSYSILFAQHIYDLFGVIKAMGITGITDVNVSALEIEAETVGAMANSSIMRSTVTKFLKINNGSISIYGAKSSTSVVYSSKNEAIYDVSKSEFLSLLNGILVFSGGNVQDVNINTTALLAMTDEQIDTILSSDILYYAVSDLVGNTWGSYLSLFALMTGNTVAYEEFEVYNFGAAVSETPVTKSFVTRESIKSLISFVRTMIP